jgi:hypothetical protein
MLTESVVRLYMLNRCSDGRAQGESGELNDGRANHRFSPTKVV